MSKVTCSIPGCDESHYGRGWCSGHYARWRASGDPGTSPIRKRRPKTICQVVGCDEIEHSRQWCKAHYQRWLDKGDPGTTPIRKQSPGSLCSIDGCDRPHKTNYMCGPHYSRWRLHGDPGGVDFIITPVPREGLSYNAAHQRIRRVLGPARKQQCIRCDVPARHWAYQHNDPHPLVARGGYLFSDNPDCYAPMCVPCHSAWDRQNGQEGSPMDARSHLWPES